MPWIDEREHAEDDGRQATDQEHPPGAPAKRPGIRTDRACEPTRLCHFSLPRAVTRLIIG